MTNVITTPAIEDIKFVRVVVTEKYGICVTFKEYGKKDASLWTLISYLEHDGTVWIRVKNPSKKCARAVTFTTSNGSFY